MMFYLRAVAVFMLLPSFASSQDAAIVDQTTQIAQKTAVLPARSLFGNPERFGRYTLTPPDPWVQGIP